MKWFEQLFFKRTGGSSAPIPPLPVGAPSDASSAVDSAKWPSQDGRSEAGPLYPGRRSVRVFVSSTFRDMMAERDALMTHTWPELRRFCRERQVELTEVDLRWGIAEEQSTRKETLKLCLDEIHACRPFFLGLLGERYGWVPDEDTFSTDLQEEQPWLEGLRERSVTELEILHGVLNNPEVAGRAFFYFRDPAYARQRGGDFLSENAVASEKQTVLKARIREICAAKHIPLHEHYADPRQLASLVLEQFKSAIDTEFPVEALDDSLTRDARDHEDFAETRRRTYVGRPEDVAVLDGHALGGGGPMALLGESGIGKSALAANWVWHWREAHPQDFILQHYIGGTVDSADYGKLMARFIGEIKRWTKDPEEAPVSREDLLKSFPLWLSKARIKAERDGVRCILVLDALNQLEDTDHARLLGWLPTHPFRGSLRLIVSTLPGEALMAVEPRGWDSLRVEPLTDKERRLVIDAYLARFGKKLDTHRVALIASKPASANPLYLKILLDELRVTGTYAGLDERLQEYLAQPDIPALLRNVLARYQRDYERDRPGLVGEALGLIGASRRGLSETELLHLLRPAHLPQLPQVLWSPLRSALEDALVDRGGIFNFAHDFLQTAVEVAFVPDKRKCDDLRLQLAAYFEAQPVSARSCDELPWLLRETDSFARLRALLLNIDGFLEMNRRDPQELRRYWIELGEQRTMGKLYGDAFQTWASGSLREQARIVPAANALALFLDTAALYADAEPLIRRALSLDEAQFGAKHTRVASHLNNLALLLQDTNRLSEAEPLMRRALAINEAAHASERPDISVDLINLASLLFATNRPSEAETMMRRALLIDEASYGPEHPRIAMNLNNLAVLLQDTNRMSEAEPLMRRVLAIDEAAYGKEHPHVARDLHNLAHLLEETNRLAEAEPMMRRALSIDEAAFGPEHPNVALRLSILARLLEVTNRPGEAEPLMRRALVIDVEAYGQNHPNVGKRLNNLAHLLNATNRMAEAEPLYRRALAIDEAAFGAVHPSVATDLNNLAGLLYASNRMSEAESLFRRALAIDERSYGPMHPRVATDLSNLALLLEATNRTSEAEILMRRALALDEASYGKDHPTVSIHINNLASLLAQSDRGAEAEPLLRRALRIDETSYGSTHPQVAIDLNNLAQVLSAAERLSEAEPLMRRALAIDVASYGSDHPRVATDMGNLAGLLEATDRLSEAEPLLRRALAIDEAAYGTEHTSVALRLNNLAQFLKATNRLSQAEPYSRRQMEIFAQFGRSTGYLHPHLQASADNYGMLLINLGRTREQILAAFQEIAPGQFDGNGRLRRPH